VRYDVGMDVPKDVVLDDIVALAKKAGERILEFFDTNVARSQKDDGSPVTAADHAANEVLVNGLLPYGIPILSEEMEPPSFGEHEYLWIIDPLDGTASFIQNRDEFSVMVGLVKNGEPVLGVVYQPKGDSAYFAQKGEGAYVERGGERTQLRVTDTNDLQDARLVMSRRAKTADSFKDIIARSGIEDVRYVSSNGVKICRIAEGLHDAFFNPSADLGQWDYCAPDSIIREAGGMITYCNGDPLLYGKEWYDTMKGVVVSNGSLHEGLLEQMVLQYNCTKE
jgi:3'(2'), 5'-bisphosphate nucleotidase